MTEAGRVERVIAALESHPILRGCPEGTVARVVEVGTVQSFAPGELLSREGDPADYWLLCQGSVRVLYRSEAGVEVTVKLFGAPAAWAEMAVRAPESSAASAVSRAMAAVSSSRQAARRRSRIGSDISGSQESAPPK